MASSDGRFDHVALPNSQRGEQNERIQDQMACDGLSWQLGFQYTDQQQSTTSSDGFFDHVGFASQRVEQNKNESVRMACDGLWWLRMASWGINKAPFFPYVDSFSFLLSISASKSFGSLICTAAQA